MSTTPSTQPEVQRFTREFSRDGLQPFDVAGAGGSNASGELNVQFRVDYSDGAIMGGILTMDLGGVDIDWPFTEHSCVLEGRVTITDLRTGVSNTYGPGEGWIIKQGSRTRWEVTTPSFAKSFFTITQ